MNRRIAVPAVIVVLSAVVVLGGVVKKPAPQSATAAAPLVGHLAPDFILNDILHERWSLGELKGKPVLVNFWATWCVPCRSEMPLIDSVYRSHRGQFAVLAVDKQEPGSDVSDFTRSHHLAFVPLLDSDGRVFKTYRITVQPVSFWIGTDGRVRSIHYGPMEKQYILDQISRLRTG